MRVHGHQGKVLLDTHSQAKYCSQDKIYDGNFEKAQTHRHPPLSNSLRLDCTAPRLSRPNEVTWPAANGCERPLTAIRVSVSFRTRAHAPTPPSARTPPETMDGPGEPKLQDGDDRALGCDAATSAAANSIRTAVGHLLQ